MSARVKLCAIAKDEGPYLADWIFHHLHFGFDAVEIWVNGTEDASPRILANISARYPAVTGDNADRLLAECLASQDNFQWAAYAQMARTAREQGYTHVAFLDLDEYWVPADFESSIKTYLPDDPAVNVISFQWAMDTPDRSRTPFTPPFAGPERVQLDPHVKSVVRLDDSVRRYREHTARTHRGTRLLVREPFPMVDARAQRRGSFTTRDFLVQHWDRVPEAFVVHRVNRSQLEYLASLTKGLRQTGLDFAFKPNRGGYLPTSAPVLTFGPQAEQLEDYRRRRQRFRDETEVSELTAEAEALASARADELLASVLADPAAMSQLRASLVGISAPQLDATYPGWEVESITCHVDHVDLTAVPARVVGWAFDPGSSQRLQFALHDGHNRDWPDLVVHEVPRPDVSTTHPDAPELCGFEIELPAALRDRTRELVVLVRAQGSTLWQAVPLIQAAQRKATTAADDR